MELNKGKGETGGRERKKEIKLRVGKRNGNRTKQEKKYKGRKGNGMKDVGRNKRIKGERKGKE